MTRDELKQAIFDALRADKERQWDTPAVELEVIMSLVDAYSVEVLQGAPPLAYPSMTTEQARAWLKERK